MAKEMYQVNFNITILFKITSEPKLRETVFPGEERGLLHSVLGTDRQNDGPSERGHQKIDQNFNEYLSWQEE